MWTWIKLNNRRRKLWTALKRRYVNEDAGNKSFLINKHIVYKTNNSKPAMKCADAGEPISESFPSVYHHWETSNFMEGISK